MVRHTKGADGLYHIGGNTYKELVGSRAKVGHGTAYATSGGLTKGKLHFNKRSGRWVSAVKSRTAKRSNNLVKHGWALAKKGSFGATAAGTKRSTQRRRKSKSGGRTRSKK
jgi:hypothetical protein